jgi:hypothetical protein
MMLLFQAMGRMPGRLPLSMRVLQRPFVFFLLLRPLRGLVSVRLLHIGHGQAHMPLFSLGRRLGLPSLVQLCLQFRHLLCQKSSRSFCCPGFFLRFQDSFLVGAGVELPAVRLGGAQDDAMDTLRKGEGTEGLTAVLLIRGDAHDHQTLVLRPQGVLQQVRELGVTEGDVLLSGPPVLLPALSPSLLTGPQGLDDVPECRETLVDVLCLF